MNGPEMERIRKRFYSYFKQQGKYLSEVDYINVTLKVSKNSFKPYTKSNS